MKKAVRNLLGAAMLIAASLQTHAQSTLIYDQQSATSPATVQQIDGFNLQEDQPLVQSFIPTLSAIEFIQFQFFDISGNGSSGATVYVNLWSGSPDADSHFDTLLGSTAPVYMPDGFGNNGFSAGVTNFYFSTPIIITPGQTYYLQPVVQSGDNPWDIVVLTNTYPNGQLYANGSALQPGSDFWFREGVVPEPTTLAILGLSSFLAFSFRHRSKLFILSLFIVPILSVHAADSVVQATADQAGLSRVSGTALSGDNGTFWVMTLDSNGSLDKLPYPFLLPKLSVLPIYSVLDNSFIVDDTGGSLLPASAGKISNTQAIATAQQQAESVMNLIELIEGSSTSNNNGVHAMDADLSPPCDDCTNSGGGSPLISYPPINIGGLNS